MSRFDELQERLRKEKDPRKRSATRLGLICEADDDQLNRILDIANRLGKRRNCSPDWVFEWFRFALDKAGTTGLSIDELIDDCNSFYNPEAD